MGFQQNCQNSKFPSCYPNEVVEIPAVGGFCIIAEPVAGNENGLVCANFL